MLLYRMKIVNIHFFIVLQGGYYGNNELGAKVDARVIP